MLGRILWHAGRVSDAKLGRQLCGLEDNARRAGPIQR
jgi:hypothetical protein